MRGRSVIELMILWFTFVVGFAILASGAMIAIIEIKDPTADTESATDVLFASITTILGALLGLIAGKSEATARIGERVDDEPPKRE